MSTLSKSKKISITLLILALLLGAGLLVARQKKRIAAEKPAHVMPVVVSVQALQTSRVTLTQPLLAEVQAVNEANIASRLTGYITELRPQEGTQVKKGELLLRLDSTEAKAQLMRADAELARTQLQQATLGADLAAARAATQAARDRTARTQKLHDIQGVSLEQLQIEQSNLSASEARLAGTQAAGEAYQSSLAAAKAAQRAAQDNLAYADIRAPFDATVAARPVQMGDLATPGKLLLRLLATDEQRLLVNLPDTVQPVGVLLHDKMLALKPWPEASAQGLRRYEARASQLVPGTRQSVQLLVFDASAVLLPDACLLNNNGQTATVFQLDAKGAAQPLKVALAAAGTQGAASTDARLNGIRIACGGADVLTRLALGAPFVAAKGQ
jgi:multidrug resistance efflux pump